MMIYLLVAVVVLLFFCIMNSTLISLLSRRSPRHERLKTKERSWDVTKVKTSPRDVHAVCKVIFLLRQVTIPDLIPEILDLAQYWVVTSAARASRQAKFTASNTGQPYVMATLPEYLPRGSVRKTAFSTVSRDQGWSSYPADHNTYENSHTWFEVAVYEPDENRPASFCTGMRVVTNIHAGKEWKKHDVVWTHDSGDERVRDVIANLKGGQRIAVTACAAYPGWENRVSSASIDIYTPRVRRG
jgi:hypothetical protein